MTPIHIKVREARETHCMGQAQLAETAGVTQSTVSRKETGKVCSLDLEVFARLDNALEVHPASLIERREE